VCGKHADKKCQKCSTRYCSVECQVSVYASHKSYCETIYTLKVAGRYKEWKEAGRFFGFRANTDGGVPVLIYSRSIVTRKLFVYSTLSNNMYFVNIDRKYTDGGVPVFEYINTIN
jgi:hypothetical protein